MLHILIVGANIVFFFLVLSSSVSFILQLIYSFQQQRPHSKTMARWLRVELTSIIMQIWGKKRPIVPRSSKFLPPPVLDIQVNKLARVHSKFPHQDPLRVTQLYLYNNAHIVAAATNLVVYVCVADHFHEHQTLMACNASALSSAD